MDRSWFTLRKTVSRCSRCSGSDLARQAIEDKRDELMNAGQGCAQFVRNVGKEFIFELELLAPAHVERGQQGLALNRVTHGACQLLAVEAALDQIVLHALVDGADRHVFVVQAGQHDDGDAGRVPRAPCGKSRRHDCREDSGRAAPWRGFPPPSKPVRRRGAWRRRRRYPSVPLPGASAPGRRLQGCPQSARHG